MFDSITTKWLHTEVCTLKSGQSLGVLNLVWMTVRNIGSPSPVVPLLSLWRKSPTKKSLVKSEWNLVKTEWNRNVIILSKVIKHVSLRMTTRFMMTIMNRFGRMVARQKATSLISSRHHCWRFSSLEITHTPRAGFEPVQNVNSSFVQQSCAVVITTTPRSHTVNHFMEIQTVHHGATMQVHFVVI